MEINKANRARVSNDTKIMSNWIKSSSLVKYTFQKREPLPKKSFCEPKNKRLFSKFTILNKNSQSLY